MNKTEIRYLAVLLLFIACSIGVSANVLAASRLVNLSTNGYVSDFGLRAGFIIQGSEPRRVIITGEKYQSDY